MASAFSGVICPPLRPARPQGWINDENPLPKARAAADTGFQTPLDEVDAAARVLDPLFGPLNDAAPFPVGLFFKDYAETEW